MSDVNFMIDTEALSDRTDGCLLSIGAVKFNWEGQILSEFYVNVDPASCKALGFKIKKSTIEWWSKQNPEALKAFAKGAVPVQNAIDQLIEWAGGDWKNEWWCYGMNYDFPMITNYCDALDKPEPWKYFNLRDARTVIQLAGIDMQEGRETQSVYHNALEDCKWQVQKLVKALS